MPAHIIKPWRFQFEPLQECVVDMVLYFQQRLLPRCRFQLALPNRHYSPTHLFQRFLVTSVTLLVALYLLPPKVDIGMRQMPVHLVPVPKAPVYENHNAILAQHDIRRAGQALHVLTVTVTAREEVTADNPLGFRIPAPYPRHDGRTLFLAPNIHAV